MKGSLPFINLHRHSRWSLLDGTGSGDQYAAQAVLFEQPALALTDHGTLAGVLEHIKACDDHGIFPISGVEVYFRENRLIHSKENAPKYHLTLLAMDFTGWLNLMRITSEAWHSGFYSKPCVDWDLLERHSEGIYCTTGCVGGLLSNLIMLGEQNPVDMYLKRMKSIFRDNLAVEIMPHDFDKQRTSNIGLINVAVENSIPIVATGDSHYPIPEWAPTQDVMLMIATQQSRTKRKAKKDAGEDIYTMYDETKEPTLHLMNGDMMMELFRKYHPSIPPSIAEAAIKFSTEIPKKFTPFLIDRDLKMPRLTKEVISKIDPHGYGVEHPSEAMAFSLDGDEVDDTLIEETLARWCREGMEKISNRLSPAEEISYNERWAWEFDVMKRGKNLAYMLMVAGEIRWAKEQGIIVGPGRGSAAGSLVAYLVGITGIDPIAYDLSFERFLNPDRKGLPDIDIDFQPDKRAIVKNHTGDVYGHDRVMDIAAYGTYGPKKALKDACRVYDDMVDYKTAVKVTEAIDLKPTEKDTLPECAERFPDVKQFSIQFKEVWEHAVRIEGHPFSQSAHASGTIVTPKPISHYMPTATRSDKNTGSRSSVTAWPDTKELLANLGFLKIDYLVIDGLTRQAAVIDGMKKRGVEIDLANDPVTWDPFAVDERVMRAFGNGETLGVWQFEGKGTVPVLKNVQPSNMHDVAAVNALIRPGARGGGITDEYAKRKHGQIASSEWYWHESVEPFLKKTYGLMIYQEQAMQIAQALGGFTPGEADSFRKAMGKKYREGMPAVIKFLQELGFEEKFVDNCSAITGGKLATEIWRGKMLPLGGYSFNASHAYAYGLISYYDGLLKATAPADYYASLLTGTASKDLARRLKESVREGKDLGLKVSPPHINLSGYGFNAISHNEIAFGIDSIKGVGDVAARVIFENRPYENFEDFSARVPKKSANKKVKEALIASGAFDTMGERVFLSPDEKADEEYKVIGMRVSADSYVEQHTALMETTCHTDEEIADMLDGESVCVGGEITEVSVTKTRAKGEEMGFVTLEWPHGRQRVTFFHKPWMTNRSFFEEGNAILINGKKQVSESYGDSIIGLEVMQLADLVAQNS
jgi:DNA polymerase-3 subunit alpha